MPAVKAVYTPHHRAHDVTRETWLGVPIPAHEVVERAERIRAALIADGGFEIVAPTEHGEAPILAVHDAGLVRFLEAAWPAFEQRASGRDYLTGIVAGYEPWQHLRHLVECFTCRVIHGAAENFVVGESAYLHQKGVTAAYDQRNIRFDGEGSPVFQAVFAIRHRQDARATSEKWRKQMAFEMIDCEIRPPKAKCEAFRHRCTNHERACQTWSARCGKGVDVP